MASEYSVNISLNTRKAEDGLKKLRTQIDGLGTKKGRQSKQSLTDAEKLIKQQVQALTVENKALTTRGSLIKLEQKGIKFKSQQARLDKAITAAQSGQFDFARLQIQKAQKGINLANNRLAAERKITSETAKQRQAFLRGAPTGFTAAQFGPQMAPTKGAGQAAMSIDTILKQQQKRLGFETQLRKLEAQGVNTSKIRVKMGKLVDAQNARNFGTIKILNSEIGKSITKETSKLNILRQQNRERLQGNRMLVGESVAQGAFSRLSDRQSRDVLGNRTFMNNPFAGFMGRRFGTTRGFDTQSALISGGFPLLFGQGPVGAAAGALGGGIGGMFGQMGGFAGGIAATAVVQQLSNVVNGVKELAESITTLDGQFNLLTEKSLFSTKEAENRAKVLQSLGEREKLATLISQELANVLGQDGADKLRRAGEASKELNKTIAELTINLQLALAGPIAQFLKLVNQVLDQGTSISLGQGKGTVNLGPGEEKFLRSFSGVLANMNQSQIDRILRAEIGTNVEGLQITNERRQAIRKFDLARQTNPAGLDAFMGGGSSFAGGKTPLEVDAARVASAQKKVKAMQKEVEFSKLVVEEGLKEADIQKQIQSITENLNEEELKLLDTQGLSVRALVEKNNQAKQLVENARMIEQSFKSLTQNISTDLAQGIQGLIRGTSTLNDVLNNVLNKMIDAAFNMAFFGNASGTLTKGLGLFGSLFSGFLANGGPAKAGRSYIVGEKGPELFTPGVSGMVTPNSQMGGSTNIVVNVDASGSNVEGDEEEGRQLGIALSAAIESELIKQKRPGGLLA